MWWIPGMRIFAPLTPREHRFVRDDFLRHGGPVYCTESSSVDYEMNDVIENNAEVTLCAISGARLAAVVAREELQKENIKCNIVHLVQLHPLDLQNANWRVGEALNNSKYGGLVVDDDFEAGMAKLIAYDIFHAIGKPMYALGPKDRTPSFAQWDNFPPTKEKIMVRVKEVIAIEKERQDLLIEKVKESLALEQKL